MRKAHREAAKALYEERNSHHHSSSFNSSDVEFYIDLHGLHPEEAVEYLENVLISHANANNRLGGSNSSSNGRIVYAITGTGHHSKNGKDKVGKAVRNWLSEGSYTYREFSVPGERGGYVGGVLGIEATSGSRRLVAADGNNNHKEDGPVPLVGGKIQVLKREEISS
jgi:Smr domain